MTRSLGVVAAKTAPGLVAIGIYIAGVVTLFSSPILGISIIAVGLLLELIYMTSLYLATRRRLNSYEGTLKSLQEREFKRTLERVTDVVKSGTQNIKHLEAVHSEQLKTASEALERSYNYATNEKNADPKADA